MDQSQIVLCLGNGEQNGIVGDRGEQKPVICVRYRNKQYYLCDLQIVKQSEFLCDFVNFKKEKVLTFDNLQFDQTIAHEILQLFQKKQLKFPISKSIKYLPAIKYFGIQSLLQTLKSTIIKNIKQQNIFELIGIAYNINQQQIFQLCLQLLQKQNYQQIRYDKRVLLELNVNIFKFILKSHNQFRSQRGGGSGGIGLLEVCQYVKEYCQIHQLGIQGYKEIVFETFDYNRLSSSQYKQIFMDNIIQGSKRSIQRKRSTSQKKFSRQQPPLQFQASTAKYSNNLTQASTSLKHNNNQFHKQMMITFLKKQNKQLLKQNKILKKQLEKIKQLTQQNSKIQSQMIKDIQYLKQELKKKQKCQEQSKKLIYQIQPLICKLQQQIQIKQKEISMLLENQKKALDKSDQIQVMVAINQEQDKVVKSQYLSADFLHTMFSGTGQTLKKLKGPTPKRRKLPQISTVNQQQAQNNNTTDTINEAKDDWQKIYSHRITFDKLPTSINKQQIANLCKLIPFQFKKKHINLIYRRSKTAPQIGQKSDLRNKKSLLVLINTQYNKHIGGYISSTLPETKSAYVTDENSFIFSLTENIKSNIDPTQAQKAIFLSQSYLLAFANDSLIAANCLTDKSYCFWPSAYQDTTTNINNNINTNQFFGNSQFLINDIQIFEILEEELEMVI